MRIIGFGGPPILGNYDIGLRLQNGKPVRYESVITGPPMAVPKRTP